MAYTNVWHLTGWFLQFWLNSLINVQSHLFVHPSNLQPRLTMINVSDRTAPIGTTAPTHQHNYFFNYFQMNGWGGGGSCHSSSVPYSIKVCICLCPYVFQDVVFPDDTTMYVIGKCTDRSHIFKPKTLQQQVSRRRAECLNKLEPSLWFIPQNGVGKTWKFDQNASEETRGFHLRLFGFSHRAKSKTRNEKPLTMLFSVVVDFYENSEFSTSS